MAPKRYVPDTAEPQLAETWQQSGVYQFDPTSDAPVFSIDTPPPTVSGFLHLGHVYSYSHADFIARFWRMNGHNVFYPMGYDDNGLPTERLVERRYKITAEQVGRAAFIEKCLDVSREIEVDYERLWQRLGLSIDWRYTYSTIGDLSRRTSQQSFVDLFHKDLVYQRTAPTIWCPTCRTAIAQAEENDLERTSEFVNLAFTLDTGVTLEVATTRPELLPACVAVLVHPDDKRYQDLAGHTVTVPLFGQQVPLLQDAGADPEKGTGAVMCCTFGDTKDVEWWYTHDLPLKMAINPDGSMSALAEAFEGMSISDARKAVKERLTAQGLLLSRRPVEQSVRVHERCDTPVEYMVTKQWFARVLDNREQFLQAGERIDWHPPQMQSRYRDWVANLNWDWTLSRQRFYGVPFPVWYCSHCDEVMVAEPDELPVDPMQTQPTRPCSCGSTDFLPDEDVMDTWATSSLSPQIVGQWLQDPELYARVFPFSMRPQAHEIIRTWAFYTIVKSQYHFDELPWHNVLISGWGLAPEGAGKISKSRGGGPMPPLEMIERYSADAARYWAASAGPGKDAIISEEKIGAGAKLVTKLWNVAGFSKRFLEGYRPSADLPALSPADRWILSRLQRLIGTATRAFENYDYAVAKNETENFFWSDLADNYLEMAKKRLYDADNPGHEAACYTLYRTLLGTISLFAPIMPFVTETIYRDLFSEIEGIASLHRAPWPRVDESLISDAYEAAGNGLVDVATAVRRYKSDHSLSLGIELERLLVATQDRGMAEIFAHAADDISSVTRARVVQTAAALDGDLEVIQSEGIVQVALQR